MYFKTKLLLNECIIAVVGNNLKFIMQKLNPNAMHTCIYIYIYSLHNVPLLTSVDVVPLMKTAGVVENSEHCIYSIGLKSF